MHAGGSDEEREGLDAAEPGLGFLTPRFHGEGFPRPQLLAYIGSLLLTGASFVLVARHAMSPNTLLAVILVLAGGQAGIQLGVFMHLRESRGPAWQIIPLGLAILIGLGVVGTAIWIMLFKWGVS